MKNHSVFVRAARRWARRSHSRYPMGAVIAKGGSILACGHNKHRTHPLSQTIFQTIHAELDVLHKARHRGVQGADLYVVRMGLGPFADCFRMAKPCEACQAIIEEAGIARVFYTNADGHMEMMV